MNKVKFIRGMVQRQIESQESRAIYKQGVLSSNVQWILYEDGEMYIYGTGSVDYMAKSNPSWVTSDNNLITKLTFEEGITTIPKYWGYYRETNWTSVSDIYIPHSWIEFTKMCLRYTLQGRTVNIYYDGTEAEWNALSGSDTLGASIIMHYLRS